MFAETHVDEIDHHQTADIAQPQLAGHFVGGFDVDVEDRLVVVGGAGGAAGIDVDGGERLG